MTDNKVTKELTVKWIVKDKKLIKFIEDDNTYKLADNVLNFLDKIKPNTPVNITIIDEKITFIGVRNVENSPEKEVNNAEQENNDIVEQEVKEFSKETYTVKAISKTREFYLFEEAGEKEWFTVTNDVKNFLKNVKKGDTLEISYEIKSEKNNKIKVINFAKIVNSNTSEPETKEEKSELKTTTKKSSYRDEDSMDKRTALMVSKDIVVSLIQESKIENKQIEETLNDLTKTCYKIIQAL